MTQATAQTLSYGEVFTRRWVVEVLLDLTGYTTDRDLGGLHLLEPSCGSGAFLGPAVERLLTSARASGRTDVAPRRGPGLRPAARPCRCHPPLVPTSADSTPARQSRRRRSCQRPGSTTPTSSCRTLQNVDDQPADVAIGNPPYIRYDDLPTTRPRPVPADLADHAGARRHLRRLHRALPRHAEAGRHASASSAPTGGCATSTAPRCASWSPSRYAVEHVWTMHDVDAFEDQVSAYPAITVLANAAAGGRGRCRHDRRLRRTRPPQPWSRRVRTTVSSPTSPTPA